MLVYQHVKLQYDTPKFLFNPFDMDNIVHFLVDTDVVINNYHGKLFMYANLTVYSAITTFIARGEAEFNNF